MRESSVKSIRRPRVAAYVKKGITHVLRDQPQDSTVIYHSAFPIGEAIASIHARRIVDGGIPSLAHLVEQILGEDFPIETPEQAARRGIICGLLWRVDVLLGMGGSGGFSFGSLNESEFINDYLKKSTAAKKSVSATMDCPSIGN